MAEKSMDREIGFGEAFAQAAGLPRPESAESGEGDDPIGDRARPEISGEGAVNEAAGEDARHEAEAAGEDSDEAPGEEPDYRQLYERERQRLRSFQGRYRKEKERWLAERRELLENLAGAGGEAGPEGDVGQSGQAGQPDETSQSDRLELRPSPAGGPLADNPELAQAVCAMVRATVEELARPVLASLEIERHVRRIAAAHPDWEELAAGDELSEWIESQPAYLAASLRRVVESGGADEIIDLLARFKRETGRSAAGRAAGQARREREAERAAAVPSRTAGPAKGRPDKGDFRAAWSEAASGR